MERVPQVMVNLGLPSRRPLSELPKTLERIGLVRNVLGEEGRVLVRWSGTEPKLRIMVEGLEESRINEMAQDIAHQAEREFLHMGSLAGAH